LSLVKSTSSNRGGSGFCRGSSARVLMMLTIFEIGVITIFYVSLWNSNAPAVKIIQVKIVVRNWSIASYVDCDTFAIRA
jgi:hypothetical protein